ncbi:small nuclear ribonucleoprotein Sm D3 [Coelomomyces lativittatus]|nr:small nuclear ribonucleoprotein Sm D3 [Coelomomyces lativittatus]
MDQFFFLFFFSKKRKKRNQLFFLLFFFFFFDFTQIHFLFLSFFFLFFLLLSSMSIGVPVKLLHESVGHIVTIELKVGDTLRGKLHEAEDNMNIQLKDVTVTRRDGRIQQLDQLFVRGSHCRWFIVPDMLKNAPMFKRVGSKVPPVAATIGVKRGGGGGGGGGGRPNFSGRGQARGRGMNIRR